MKYFLTTLLAGISFGSIAQTYTGSGGAIPDVTTTDFPLTISTLSPSTIDTMTFGLETVCINLTHTYDGDLDIKLLAPDGTQLTLSSGNGGGGQDYTNTCFDENAASSIGAGSPPFTGSFRPQGALAVMNNGQNGNGTWILRITDMAAQDQGNLISWTLTFGNSPAHTGLFSSSDLPIVIINTNNVAIPGEPKIPAVMKIIDYGAVQRNHITDVPNVYNGDIGIEQRGNFSAGLPQKPYNFVTRDVNGNSIDTALLGMPSEHDWCMIACYNDKSFNRNMLASDLFQRMGHYAPRFRLCEVVLNGQYEGVYLLGELIKRDKNRVDVAKLLPTDINTPDVTGGYITKIDYWDNTNSWQLSYHPVDHPNLNVHMVYVYPKADTIEPQQKTYIQQFFNQFEGALYGGNFADTTVGYAHYISTRSFIDYFIVNELSRNVDGFKKSRYFYKEKDDANGTLGKLKAGPVWDFDWAWNDIWDCSYFQAQDGSGWSHLINDCGPDVNAPGYYVRLLQDTNFANKLYCRWTELRGTILDTSYLFHFIDSVQQRVNEGQQRHFQLYNILGQVTGTPEVNPAYSFPGEIDSLKTWIVRRINWLDANMPGSLSGCNLTDVPNAGMNGFTVQVYPNPSSGNAQLQIHTDQRRVLQVSVMNALGQTMIVLPEKTYEAGTSSVAIDAASWPAGVYFVQIRDEAGAHVVRLIREK